MQRAEQTSGERSRRHAVRLYGDRQTPAADHAADSGEGSGEGSLRDRSEIEQSNRGLLVVAEFRDHVEQFLKGDEPAAVTELVLVDRVGQFNHFGAIGLLTVTELTPLDAVVLVRSSTLPAIDEFVRLLLC